MRKIYVAIIHDVPEYTQVEVFSNMLLLHSYLRKSEVQDIDYTAMTREFKAKGKFVIYKRNNVPSVTVFRKTI
jgi:hypothetical protein